MFFLFWWIRLHGRKFHMGILVLNSFLNILFIKSRLQSTWLFKEESCKDVNSLNDLVQCFFWIYIMLWKIFYIGDCPCGIIIIIMIHTDSLPQKTLNQRTVVNTNYKYNSAYKQAVPKWLTHLQPFVVLYNQQEHFVNCMSTEHISKDCTFFTPEGNYIIAFLEPPSW